MYSEVNITWSKSSGLPAVRFVWCRSLANRLFTFGSKHFPLLLPKAFSMISNWFAVKNFYAFGATSDEMSSATCSLDRVIKAAGILRLLGMIRCQRCSDTWTGILWLSPYIINWFNYNKSMIQPLHNFFKNLKKKTFLKRVASCLHSQSSW